MADHQIIEASIVYLFKYLDSGENASFFFVLAKTVESVRPVLSHAKVDLVYIN